MRKVIGRLIEWFLRYEHDVVVDARGKMPFHKYEGDAGYDLFAAERVPIPSGCTVEVPAGLRFDPRDGIWFEIKARSSTLKKRGLEVVDAVIDRDYRGDLMAVVHNPTGTLVVVEEGDRVVQVVPHRLIPVRFRRGALSESARGAHGFGSTGGGV